MAGDENPPFDSLPIERRYNIILLEYHKQVKIVSELQSEVKDLKEKVVSLQEENMDNINEQSSSDEEEEDNTRKKPRMSSPDKLLASNTLKNKPAFQPATTSTTNKSSPPAIFAYFNNHKDLISKLTDHLKNNNFIIYIRKENVKIQCLTNLEYQATMEFLKSSNINYYTFTPKDEKPTTLFIRNISNTYDSAEIIAAIKEKVPDINIISVKNLVKFNWLIQLKTKEDVKSMKSIRSLLGQGIRVENFKGKKQMQCVKCQRYNHVAPNCNMPYRCVKCGDSHEVGKCTIPKKEVNHEVFAVEMPDGTKTTRIGVQLKCANCSGDHAASYSKCPARPKIEEPVIQPIPTRVKQHINTQSLRKPNVSYSQATNSNSHFDLNLEVNNLFGKSLNECMKKINNFIPKFKEIKDVTQKKTELCQLLFDLCIN